MIKFSDKKSYRIHIKRHRKNKKSREEHIPTDGSPEDLRRGAEVNGPVRGLGVHPLAEKPEILHFLANEATGEADFLASDHHHSLAVQELLSENGGQSPEHVVPRIDHHSLRADP